MNQHIYNNIKVYAPSWNCKVYKARPCSLLLHVTPENFDEAINAYREAGFCRTFQGLYLDGIVDLSFLEEFPLMLYLKINSPKPISTKSIEVLKNLRGLQLTKQKNGLNFSNFKELEFFKGEWHKSNKGLKDCKILKDLYFDKFNAISKDFSDLANIERLEHLCLGGGNIESLNGIETLEDLLTLKLYYLPKLKSLSQLSTLSGSLREIEATNLKNVTSYHPIGELINLRKLILSNSNSMENLSWVENLRRVRFFSFVDTTVKDGNLLPLLKLKKLDYVGTNDKRHYNITMDEINHQLNKA